LLPPRLTDIARSSLNLSPRSIPTLQGRSMVGLSKGV